MGGTLQPIGRSASGLHVSLYYGHIHIFKISIDTLSLSLADGRESVTRRQTESKEFCFGQRSSGSGKGRDCYILQFPQNLFAQVLPSMVYDCRRRTLPMQYTPSMLLPYLSKMLPSGWHNIVCTAHLSAYGLSGIGKARSICQGQNE